MEINSSKSLSIQQKENLDGTKEKFLVINCKNCEVFSQKDVFQDDCISCVLSVLKNNKNNKSKYLTVGDPACTIQNYTYIQLISYYNNQKKIKRIWNKIISTKAQKCIYKDFKCKQIHNLNEHLYIAENVFDDPIELYIRLIKFETIFIQKELNDSHCTSCLADLQSLLLNLINILDNSKIIIEFKKYHSLSKDLASRSMFYKQLFFKNQYSKKTNLIREIEINKNLKKQINYLIGEEKIFQVEIYDVKNEVESFYNVVINISNKLNNTYIEKITKDIGKNFELINIDKILSFEELIDIYKNQALNYIYQKYRFSKEEAEKLALLATIIRINMLKLFPLLIDDYVEEIFLDSPEESIYINHQKYGRCRTNIKFSIGETERLKTFLRVYSGKRLDYSNPSIKFVIKNKFFYCRFAMDVSPIQINDFALDIRKLNKDVMTIQDLLKNETLSVEMAAFLYFIILRRINITVTGETDTGKTTLINALDLITPKEFRKIYIENVIESLDQNIYNKHQLKFKVDSLEDSNNSRYSKHNQIKKLLHRTPDIIYLGEILTADEAKALFHCLSAGLRGFQTIHSNDIKSLLNRLLYHFGIDRSCLNDLGLIILMKKHQNQRRIVSVSEINMRLLQEEIVDSIFTYNPQCERWEMEINTYDTLTILNIKRFENLSKENYHFFIEIYEEIFQFLKTNDKISNIALVQLFDAISYFSFKKPSQIKDLWNNWKKTRNLN
ncbi:MAG: Flp pilus assembly complex ATPase component TadA [Candidatus Lokiarchaeota archaeon]|nr:Flp pilus assembly complex ATPase component TadA [Candidatus Lokiarchaeota archaeon]